MQVAACSPQLILMDIQLPGIDGYEVSRRIKADPTLATIPIIAVTSYALTGDDFRKVGREFTLIRNPLVALRDLNEALRLPGGAKPPLADIGTTARCALACGSPPF